MNPINAAMEGLARAEGRVERSADRIARSSAEAADGNEDSVSLSDEMIGLLEGQNAYTMNLQIIKAGAEMEKRLLDILA